MVELFEVFPRKLVAIVAVPLLLGLALLAVLFDVGPTGWALVLLTILGGVLVLFVVGARTVLLEKQNESLEDVETD